MAAKPKSKPKPKTTTKKLPSATQRLHRNIGNIGSPLSGQTMVDTARTLTAREYDPIFRDIDQSERSVVSRRGEQQDRAKAYYGDIAKLFGAQLEGQRTANAGSLGAAQAAGAAQAKAIDAAEAQARGRDAADAAVRGAGLDGGSLDSLAAASAQAKIRAAAQGATHENAARTLGAVQEAFMRGTGAATAQRGGETQGAIGARGDADLRELATSRKKLNEDRDGRMTDTLLKIRGGEVERLLTEKGISSDLAQAQIDADLKAVDIRSKTDLAREKMRFQVRLEQMGIDAAKAKQMADQQFQAGENSLNRENARTVANINHKPGAGGGFTHKDKVKAAGERDSALVTADQLKRGVSGQRASRGEALTILTDKYGADFARVAVGAIYDGGAKPHLVKLLKDRYGIGIPSRYLRR